MAQCIVEYPLRCRINLTVPFLTKNLLSAFKGIAVPVIRIGLAHEILHSTYSLFVFLSFRTGIIRVESSTHLTLYDT